MSFRLPLLTAALVAAGLAGSASAVGQTPAAKSPTVSSPELKAYMKSVVDPAANALFAAGNDAPAGETPSQATARFKAAEEGAKTLRAASAKLAAAPYVQAPDWVKFDTLMASAAGEVEAAAKTRNVDGALAAGGDLYDSCNGCHHLYQAGH